MNKNTEIQDELKSIGSSLSGMSRAMPYTVPDGYFAMLGASILSTIKEISGQDIIFERGIAAITGGVPNGYFETFPAKMLEMAKAGEEKAKIIEFKPVHERRLFLQVKWAAAAIIILTIGLGSYTFFFSDKESGADKMLSSVPSNELHDYLQNTCRMDVDRVVNNNVVMNMQLDNKDIIKYLDETGWDVVD